MQRLFALFLFGLLLVACRPAELPMPLRVGDSQPPAGKMRGDATSATLVVAVTDPLAIDNACACIAGFAQRDYRALLLFLRERFQCPVEIVFATGVRGCLAKSPTGSASLIIGKNSVTQSELAKANIEAEHVADLTNRNGETTLRGLWVVMTDDAATSVGDLASHRLLFGRPNADEKYAAAEALLRSHNVTVPEKRDEFDTCRETVQTMLELASADDDATESRDAPRLAAVVSDYALALLEGCETIPRGAVRVVGQTEPVPFIAAFVPKDVEPSLRVAIVNALADFGSEPQRCDTLETQGFRLTPEANTAARDEKKK